MAVPPPLSSYLVAAVFIPRSPPPSSAPQPRRRRLHKSANDALTFKKPKSILKSGIKKILNVDLVAAAVLGRCRRRQLLGIDAVVSTNQQTTPCLWKPQIDLQKREK
ncbi:hypothetical protein Nepgr_002744 [Nepenthes gracilis]|uniref:Uncharacterized protein n=1 Tax=Nepenthes gracilis TaxID=150966 RepID=A0AAD3RYK4_NEPGR|nr:hypothetical protein Nepgr_002744 [Nepenthes gracilis]